MLGRQTIILRARADTLHKLHFWDVPFSDLALQTHSCQVYWHGTKILPDPVLTDKVLPSARAVFLPLFLSISQHYWAVSLICDSMFLWFYIHFKVILVFSCGIFIQTAQKHQLQQEGWAEALQELKRVGRSAYSEQEQHTQTELPPPMSKLIAVYLRGEKWVLTG